MTTRELFASAIEILAPADPVRTPDPGSRPDKPRQDQPEFAAMIDHKLRPKPKRSRTHETSSPQSAGHDAARPRGSEQPSALTPRPRSPAGGPSDPQRGPFDRLRAGPRRKTAASPPEDPPADSVPATLRDAPTSKLEPVTGPDSKTAEPNDSATATDAASVPLPSVIIPFPEAPAFFGSALLEARVAAPALNGQVPVSALGSGGADGLSSSGDPLVSLLTTESAPARVTPFASPPVSIDESLAEIEIDVPWPPRRSAAQDASAPNGDQRPWQSQGSPGMAGQASEGDVIVPVDFGKGLTGLASSGWTAVNGPPLDGTSALAPSHLPGSEVQQENSAPSSWANGEEPRDVSASQARMAALFPAAAGLAGGVTSGLEKASGIASAPKAPDMDSLLDADQARSAEQADAMSVRGDATSGRGDATSGRGDATSGRGDATGVRHQKALDDLDGIAVKVTEPENPASEFPARTSSATEWQTGRPVGLTDRPTPSAVASASPAQTLDRTETVERLSQLVLRETALARQHGADSMSVVLRPDANTELFVHFSQRNGQLQAAVRCERGDFQQLNMLWPQLQESLSHQKVSLSPLEESSTPGEFRHGPGANFGGAGNDPSQQRNGSGVFERDEADAPARRATSPEPGSGWAQSDRKTGGMTPVAGRPGWETWA